MEVFHTFPLLSYTFHILLRGSPGVPWPDGIHNPLREFWVHCDISFRRNPRQSYELAQRASFGAKEPPIVPRPPPPIYQVLPIHNSFKKSHVLSGRQERILLCLPLTGSVHPAGVRFDFLMYAQHVEQFQQSHVRGLYADTRTLQHPRLVGFKQRCATCGAGVMTGTWTRYRRDRKDILELQIVFIFPVCSLPLKIQHKLKH